LFIPLETAFIDGMIKIERNVEYVKAFWSIT